MRLGEDGIVFGITPGTTAISEVNQNIRKDVVAVSLTVELDSYNDFNKTVETITSDGTADMFVDDLTTENISMYLVSDTGDVLASNSPAWNIENSVTGGVDLFGDSIGRRVVILASRGGGLMTAIEKSQTKGYVDFSLYSVVPTNSGILPWQRQYSAHSQTT